MAQEYKIIIYEVDTPAHKDADKTRYKIVAYDARTYKRADYVYNDDPEKGVKRLRKRLPYGIKITVEKEY
jgi:hypothetical protein